MDAIAETSSHQDIYRVNTQSRKNWKKPTESITQLKDRAKHSEGSGMKTDQAERLDKLLG